MGIGRIGDVRFLDRGITIHRRWVCQAQPWGPDSDPIGELAWRCWREARAKRCYLRVIGSLPGGDETASAAELGGGIVLDGPCALTVGEVGEPLEEEGSQVETPRAFSPEPPYSTSGGLPPLGGRGIGVASRGLNARVRPNPTSSATPQWGSRTCCRRLPPLGGSALLPLGRGALEI